MKKIIVAATMVSALMTASMANAQSALKTKKVTKTEQQTKSTAAPNQMGKKEEVKKENTTKETKVKTDKTTKTTHKKVSKTVVKETKK